MLCKVIATRFWDDLDPIYLLLGALCLRSSSGIGCLEDLRRWGPTFGTLREPAVRAKKIRPVARIRRPDPYLVSLETTFPATKHSPAPTTSDISSIHNAMSNPASRAMPQSQVSWRQQKKAKKSWPHSYKNKYKRQYLYLKIMHYD